MTHPQHPGRKKEPRPTLCDEEVDWLKRYHTRYDYKALAEHLAIKVLHLTEIMFTLGISKKAKRLKRLAEPKPAPRPRVVLPKQKAPPKTIVRQSQPVKYSRPPAVYSNVSREQYIEKYLKM